MTNDRVSESGSTGSPQSMRGEDESGERAMPFFRRGVQQLLRSVHDFGRGIRLLSFGDIITPRMLAFFTLGIGFAYVYEYSVVLLSVITGTAVARLRTVLTLEVSVQGLLVILTAMVYINLFLSVLVLKRLNSVRSEPSIDTDSEVTTSDSFPAPWRALNFLVGGTIGYVLAISYGTLAGGVGAGLGLLVGDMLYSHMMRRINGSVL